MNRNLWIALGAGVVLLAAAPRIAHAGKVGYVDLQRAINDVEEGQKAKSKLKKDFEDKQKVLDKRQEELKAQKEALEASAGSQVITDEAKQKQQRDFQEKLLELQKMYVEMQQDLTKAEANAMKGIVAKMRAIIAKIGKRDDFEMIVDAASVLFGPQHMDLTNEVIRMYNEEQGKSAKKGE